LLDLRLHIAGASAAALICAAPAGAAVPHTVQPGETLWSIAVASNFTTRSLAAANGLSPDAQVVAGTTIQIPSEAEAAAALGGAGAAAPSPPPAATRVADAPPYATPGFTNAAEIGQIAGAHGVSPSLAAAVAWQESGFNNGLVSSANARGVMQILPGTWSWIQDTLASGPLDPGSPSENVHAGVMYLGRLLRDTGGDERAAVASYYQGPASVRSRSLFEDTRRYVDAVMAHRERFGGP
jgi:soluble lytic murein transglycosylase-like protein